MATITIPTDEAKPGDLANIEFERDGTCATLIVESLPVNDRMEANGVRFMGQPFTLAAIHALRPDATVTISRKVPDLPKQVGTIFTAAVRGVPGVMLMVVAVENYATTYASANRVGGVLWHESQHIDPTTVELATITWGAEA